MCFISFAYVCSGYNKVIKYFDTDRIVEKILLAKQEVSSEKIIVEANGALLSLKKDSGTDKGCNMTYDGTIMTQEGPKCHKNCAQNSLKWDRKDGMTKYGG